MSTHTSTWTAASGAEETTGATRVPAVADGAGVDTGADTPGPRSGRGRWLAGALAVLVLAALVSAAVQAIASRLPIPTDTNIPRALITWSSVAGVGLLAVLFSTSRLPAWARHGAVVALLSALGTATVAIQLHGTYYYLQGLSIDQSFRTQYLTRLTDSAVPADMNYADIAPFYPSGWFWPAGRLAALTDMQGWMAYKPAALFTLGVVPAFAYWLWARLATPRIALCVGLVTVAAGLAEGVVEPYSWAVAAVLPPMAVLFWRSVAPGRRRDVAQLVGVGVLLGGALCLYTLYAAYAAMSLVVLAAVGAWAAGPGRRKVAFREAFVSLVVVAVPSALLALVVWTPYLLSVLTDGGGANVAARFLPAESAAWPDPMLDVTAWGALLAVGFGYAIWRLVSGSGRDRAYLVPLAVLVACCYAWYALSTAALAVGTTLLAFRMETVLMVTLGTAGVFALRRGWQLLGTRMAARHGASVPRIGLVAGVATTIVAVTVLQQNSEHLDPLIETAYSDSYPSGPNARGVVDDTRDERWSDALAASIDERTGRPEDDVVLLTTNYAMLSVRPYWGFQQSTPHYANPLADYIERSQFITDLAASDDAAEFEQRLDSSPWDAPTAFVLRTEDDGMHLTLRGDIFPRSVNVSFDDVVFDPDLFEGWSSEEVGPFTVYVRDGS